MDIQTGEQAISFFAKYGNNTPIKFVKCNRMDAGPTNFRPYDLEVIHEENDLNAEFFTISAEGVVHIIREKNKQISRNLDEAVPAEFFKLSDWMQQSTMFNVLTSMKFFKHYLIGKVFNTWKGNVRHKMFLRTR